ncbi:serine/threonine-protein kinase [Myxococcota bacterium]
MRLSLLLVVFAALDTVILTVMAATDGRRATVEEYLYLALCFGSLALFSGLWATARSERFRHSFVLNLGLLAEVATCFIVSVVNPDVVFPGGGSLPQNTWVVGFIIAFPLIVPCPPRRTLLTAIAAASMAPLGLTVLVALGVWDAQPRDFLWSFLNPAFAVVIAYFGSRVVYGINRDMARAQQMGSYHLESLLGRGGMGEVWRASHQMLARPAAVKLIRTDLGRDDPKTASGILERFEREAQATATLKSNHSVALYDFGRSDDGVFYYVMELLDGVDLETLIDRYGPVPPERAVHLLLQACHSLADAHAGGLIHRDIKPANIFVCQQGLEYDFVKVLDFGLVALQAKPRNEDANLTANGMVPGTPAYLAPEMAVGGQIDGRADIYALGCVAFWLLTGRPVFEAFTAVAAIVAHANQKPDPPSAVTEVTIPAELDDLVLACLEKQPDRRPQSALALAQRLAEIPLPDDWTNANAKAWWETHHPTG